MGAAPHKEGCFKSVSTSTCLRCLQPSQLFSANVVRKANNENSHWSCNRHPRPVRTVLVSQMAYPDLGLVLGRSCLGVELDSRLTRHSGLAHHHPVHHGAVVQHQNSSGPAGTRTETGPTPTAARTSLDGIYSHGV